MDNDKKLQLEIRQQKDSTYCVVQVVDGEDVVFPQTQNSTLKQAEDWLWFIQELVKRAQIP